MPRCKLGKKYTPNSSSARGRRGRSRGPIREQYFLFRASLETGLSDLYKAENRLRYLMGLAATDGRLIRPADEPTDARVMFDWSEIHAEGDVPFGRTAEAKVADQAA